MERKREGSFSEWVDKIKRDYPLGTYPRYNGWRRLDEEWLVSARDNGTYTQKAFHICPRSHMSADTIVDLDDMCPCGEVLPEGLRMVALLLEAL